MIELKEIPAWLYDRLDELGIIPNDVRSMNVGASDYSQRLIQPWAIWIEYRLNPFDADIIKRVLRHKATDSRQMDYEKIIHICQERIRQLKHQRYGNTHQQEFHPGGTDSQQDCQDDGYH